MTVFANGLEVACKAQANKVIAAFPYVCMTPPQTPATPPGVPVPYPTFGMDSDTDKGTSTVKIGGKTITQKDKSYYTKCTGNEAGSAPMKNVVSHVNTGKEYAHSWSDNVKADGEPVSRFSDLSTNDHASSTAGGAPGPKIAKKDFGTAGDDDCLVGSWEEIHENCNKRKDPDDIIGKKNPAPAAWQAHHIVPDRCYRVNGDGDRIEGSPTREQGICICLPRSKHSAARTNPDEDVTVHHFLDDALTELGHTRPRRQPEGVAKVSKIRNESLNALAELIDDPVSAECFDAAADEVVDQTQPFEDKYARAEKSSRDFSSKAEDFLGRQRFPSG